MRSALWTVVLLSSAVASAQPADPYGAAPATPSDPYAPTAPTSPALARPIPPSTPPTDPVLSEQVAQSLAARAQELFDARLFADARQLALEALQQSAKGPAGEQARLIVRQANRQLGLPDEPLPGDTIKIDVKAVDEPEKDPVTIENEPLPPQPERPDNKLASRVHGALYVGLLGTTVGAFLSKQNPENGAIPLGIGGAIGGALLAPVIEDKLGWSEAQIRTVGSATAWGGVAGGFFGDAVKKQGTTGRQVLVGASLGATLGGLAGAGIASQDRFTRGDVALVDTLAGIGTIGGLTLGMLMQPAESEAYSVNAIVGGAAGWITGYVAGPLTDTTPRRMLRVAGVSALGGAAGFLLWPLLRDDTTKADERVVGFVSSAGLVVGAYIGFRLTRDMADGTDTKATKKDLDELGLVHRHADGHWALGTLGLQPLSAQLAPQPGASVPLLGGSW